MKSFKGLFTAIVTPFDQKGNVNLELLTELIRTQIEAKVDGIVILGTTGEAPTITHEEEQEIIKLAVRETKGKTLLLVGTGLYSTQKTIESTKLAQKLGADGALIVTPYYNRPTQEGIYLHFKAITEAVELPILLYNVQSRTGQNIQTSTLRRLAEFPSIVGVKEASGSIAQIMEVIEVMRKERPDFTVLSGDDLLALPLIAAGGHGLLSVISNLVPHEVNMLVQAALRGDLAKAREIHYRLMPLIRAAFIETNPMPIKAAMNLCGIPVGSCRLPLCDLLPESKSFLLRTLEEIGALEVVDLKL